MMNNTFFQERMIFWYQRFFASAFETKNMINPIKQCCNSKVKPAKCNFIF